LDLAMTRESPQDKATRYLNEHRVAIDTADWAQQFVVALVQGSAPEPYLVTHTRAQGWACQCPYPLPACVHLIAVRRVFPDPVPVHTPLYEREKAASAARGLVLIDKIGAKADLSWQ
jgi:hypothetical protein